MLKKGHFIFELNIITWTSNLKFLINLGAWVAHTAAVRGLEIPQPPPSIR